MDLDCQRVDAAAAAAALSWANEVALLGDRDQSEGLDDGVGHDNILMDQHASMQGFSLMMMAAENGQSFHPMILMGQESTPPPQPPPPPPQPPVRTPSTVLSLQTMPPNEENSSKAVTKKRGRQKGPGKPKSHYVKERDSSFQLVLKLPLKSRKLFCVAEFYKYMAQSSSDSLCKVTEAYAKAGESVGVSGKTARKWVEDWERRADGTFSESQQGKHVKVEWLLQPEHLQSKARAWIEQNCPKKGEPPRKDSIIKMFRDFCNNDLLLDVQAGDLAADSLMGMTSHRKISTETARSWLHRLGFNNFKDFRKSSTKSLST
ncbi:hypothetical protein SELMODRAFT_438228 [Selaginella moellendorffii]|nr:hypothetical protein SELMODRAFT_438228 [Selaginella moellendorffii]